MYIRFVISQKNPKSDQPNGIFTANISLDLSG